VFSLLLNAECPFWEKSGKGKESLAQCKKLLGQQNCYIGAVAVFCFSLSTTFLQASNA